MKNMLLAGLVMSSALYSVTASAAVGGFVMHGNSCTWASGGPVGYGQFGVYASSTVGAVVNCPIPQWNRTFAGTWAFAKMKVFDRHPANFICNLVQTDADGNVVSTSGMQTFSANQNSSLWMSQPDFQLVGFPYLQCTIPGTSNGNASHIIQYQVHCSGGQLCLQ
jgi:hypothetical protein